MNVPSELKEEFFCWLAEQMFCIPKPSAFFVLMEYNMSNTVTAHILIPDLRDDEKTFKTASGIGITARQISLQLDDGSAPLIAEIPLTQPTFDMKGIARGANLAIAIANKTGDGQVSHDNTRIVTAPFPSDNVVVPVPDPVDVEWVEEPNEPTT